MSRQHNESIEYLNQAAAKLEQRVAEFRKVLKEVK